MNKNRPASTTIFTQKEISKSLAYFSVTLISLSESMNHFYLIKILVMTAGGGIVILPIKMFRHIHIFK